MPLLRLPWHHWPLDPKSLSFPCSENNWRVCYVCQCVVLSEAAYTHPTVLPLRTHCTLSHVLMPQKVRHAEIGLASSTFDPGTFGLCLKWYPILYTIEFTNSGQDLWGSDKKNGAISITLWESPCRSYFGIWLQGNHYTLYVLITGLRRVIVLNYNLQHLPTAPDTGNQHFKLTDWNHTQ